MQDKELIEKIKAPLADKTAEVVDFVNFLADRNNGLLVEAMARISEPAFAAVWTNSHDAGYDNL